jgi:hypothetical protein
MKRKISLAIAFVLVAALFYFVGWNTGLADSYKERPPVADDGSNLNSMLTRGELLQDYNFYQRTLSDLHPGLYKWHSEKELAELFDSVRALLDKPMSRAKFYSYLSIVNNRIGCSHTSLDFHKEYKQSGFFPIPIVCIGSEYYSTCSDCTIPKGSRFLYINGEKMEKIAEKLEIYESVDACNQYVSLQKITQNFALKYFLTFGEQDQFEVSYEDYETKTVKSTTLTAEPNSFRYAADWHPFWYNDFEYDMSLVDSQHTAILKLRTFTYQDGSRTDGYINFLHNSFRLLSLSPQYKNLVIDLRNNPGGENDNCYLLYSYLTKRSFYEDSTAYINSFTFPQEYILGGISEDNLDSVKKKYYQSDDHFKRFSFIPSKATKWDVSPYAFKGKIFVITNTGSASASVRLASLLQLSDSVKIIGEIPEGAYWGATAYYDKEYLLPNSEITLTIPLVNVKYNVPSFENRHSPELLPDYIVPLNEKDFLSGEDTQLEFIYKRLIKN